MSIAISLEHSYQHMSAPALRSLAARAYRRGWRSVLQSIKAEFNRRRCTSG